MSASLRTHRCTLYRPEDRGSDGVSDVQQVRVGQAWGRIAETSGTGRVVGERPESRADATILFGADAHALLHAGGVVVGPDGRVWAIQAILARGADWHVTADRADATLYALVDA